MAGVVVRGRDTAGVMVLGAALEVKGFAVRVAAADCDHFVEAVVDDTDDVNRVAMTMTEAFSGWRVGQRLPWVPVYDADGQLRRMVWID